MFQRLLQLSVGNEVERRGNVGNGYVQLALTVTRVLIYGDREEPVRTASRRNYRCNGEKRKL